MGSVRRRLLSGASAGSAVLARFLLRAGPVRAAWLALRLRASPAACDSAGCASDARAFPRAGPVRAAWLALRLRASPAAGSACAAALLAAVSALACNGSGADAPNVLLIVMDTTRADRCSVAGGAAGTTPRLDALAADGVSFTDAWSPAGWTAPAHASLFTGLLPERHLVDHGLRMYLDASIPTIASELRRGGWETACFTNNELVGSGTGLTRGFDRVDELFGKTWRPYPYCTDTHRRTADWALGVARRGGRFFAFVNDMEPHLPYTPPAEFERRFLPDDVTQAEIEAGRAFDFPETLRVITGQRVLTPRERAVLRGLYDAEIACLDESVGALLDELRTAGVLDRTLVIVCGDHGENLGDHGLADHRFSLHRSVRHVPLVVRLPGQYGGGRRIGTTVRLQDVFPTVLEACGLPVPDGIDGATLRTALPGAVAPRPAPATHGPVGPYVNRMREAVPDGDLTPLLGSWRAIYDGRLHYIGVSDGREELYDVPADPAEERNLAPSGGADLDRLKKAAAPRR